MKAQGFLGQATVVVAETVNANKVRYDEAAALKLLDGVQRFIAVKGKKVEVFDLTKDPPTDAELIARLIGPTGNLRAPTARIGTTLVVGFNEDAYKMVLGG